MEALLLLAVYWPFLFWRAVRITMLHKGWLGGVAIWLALWPPLFVGAYILCQGNIGWMGRMVVAAVAVFNVTLALGLSCKTKVWGFGMAVAIPTAIVGLFHVFSELNYAS